MGLIADGMGICEQCKSWNYSIDEQKMMYDGTDLGESFRVRKDAWMLGTSEFYLRGEECHIVGVSPFTDGETVYLHFVLPRKNNINVHSSVKHIPIRRELLKRSRILLIERNFKKEILWENYEIKRFTRIGSIYN